MGLDTVELVMGLEDEFEVQIPDALAAKMGTIGETVAGITELLKQREWPVGICPGARSFYRLRQELMHRFEVPRSSVKLDVPIGTLVQPSMRGGWKKVADAAGLRRERFRLFKSAFPPAQTSVRELIQSRCKQDWRRFDGEIDSERVFQHVRRIASEQLGVPMDRIGRETKYIEDLGAD